MAGAIPLKPNVMKTPEIKELSKSKQPYIYYENSKLTSFFWGFKVFFDKSAKYKTKMRAHNHSEFYPILKKMNQITNSNVST